MYYIYLQVLIQVTVKQKLINEVCVCVCVMKDLKIRNIDFLNVSFNY